MKTKIIEATSNEFNWGKFMIAEFTPDHWRVRSVVDALPLLRARGWSTQHLWVLDLQTGEGACFRRGPGGHARSDLNNHQIWVCPLFEPFLEWLYAQTFDDLDQLPAVVDLPNAKNESHGYRRSGPNARLHDTIDALQEIIKRQAGELSRERNGSEALLMRSPNYASMSPREQWEEDKRLGLLDLEPTKEKKTADG